MFKSIKPVQKLASTFRRQSLLERRGMEVIQDEIFKKMSVDQKLSLLDEFFKFGKELQNLNNRKLKQAPK